MRNIADVEALEATYRKYTVDKLYSVMQASKMNLRDKYRNQRIALLQKILDEVDGYEAGDEPQEDLSGVYEALVFEKRLAKKYLAKVHNAEERGIEMTLTLADMRKLMTRKTCGYTKVKLLDDVDSSHPHKRTLERKDPTIGYTKANTIACTHACNKLKNILFEAQGGLGMSIQELRNFSNNMVK